MTAKTSIANLIRRITHSAAPAHTRPGNATTAMPASATTRNANPLQRITPARRIPTLLALSILLALAALLPIGAPTHATSHFVDYDADNDNYIDVSTHGQLNAIRYDLDSNGSVSSSDQTNYEATGAFPNPATGMGCPGTCVGYELTQNIDLDTNGSGGNTWTSADAYWDGGKGWAPISTFTGKLKGNGYEIQNLFISRSGTDNVGLFGEATNAAVIEGFGVTNAAVTGKDFVGIIVGLMGNFSHNNANGSQASKILGCWTTGSVTGAGRAGGLVGRTIMSDIHSSYSTASVTASGNEAGGLAGWSSGLFGHTYFPNITNSYATGAVTAASRVGGITGYASSGAKHAGNYWDTTTGPSAGVGYTSPGAPTTPTTGYTGKTTAELQSPTGYTGIYSTWNANVDGVGGNDDPWVFGTSSQYPTLKYGKPVDYDADGDNLIEISDHFQLNAVRYDVDGNGARGSTTTSDWTTYTNAFPRAASGMGCAATCAGYELANSIDLDTSGSGGSTWTSADAYWNSGAGWTPIGSSGAQANMFQTTFRGNGFEVQNLFTATGGSSNDYKALFGAVWTNGRIESLGVTSASIGGRNYLAAIVADNRGAVVASWSTGAIDTGTTSPTDGVAGGLVGYNAGSVHSSYSSAAVSATRRLGGLVGIIPGSGSITNSYSIGNVTRKSGSTHTTFGGLLGENESGGTVTASYWDTTLSTQTTSAGGTGASGQTTTQLQSPTAYTGIYATWNANIDDAPGRDDPWDFGGISTYPTLVYHFTDYDSDEDGYIEISTHQQLNAVRWDLDGNGSVSATNRASYNAAFPNASTSGSKPLGCPGSCSGYELANNIDLDTSGSGGNTWTSADAYYNGGSGWDPIGDSTNQFNTNFKGNAYTIDNLYIRRTTSSDTNIGLFGFSSTSARIESLGVTNADVAGYRSVGILIGQPTYDIIACYTTGSVSGSDGFAGGLVGYLTNEAVISTSYSTASVSGTRDSGGLVGYVADGDIINSYSTGRVTRTSGSATSIGGLVGDRSSTQITATASYWDTQTSNQSSSVIGLGQTTSALQGPTDYTGIYAAWNANLDGQAGNDDPWDFGTSSDYPTLKYGKPIDYDTDDDNLIEINSHAKLNAVRWDLDGDGEAADDHVSSYAAAFPNPLANMGCAAACAGYELVNDIDLDTSGSGGSTWTSADAYHNGGSGWDSIGHDANDERYTAKFNGNGFEVQNLDIDRTTHYNGLFGAISSDARIEALGVTGADLNVANYSALLVGANRGGEIVASWSTGSITAAGAGDGVTGGLVGYNTGDIHSGYSTASVTGVQRVGGLVGINTFETGSNGSITNSYSTGAVTRGSGSAATIGGLVGEQAATATTTASYYDSTTSGCVSGGSNGCTTSAAGTAQTTAALQAPLGYGGIYAAWNANLDGVAGGDNPWNFGSASQYPTLHYTDPVDYDLDGDNYIDIVHHAMLNAIRWDLDGNGAVSATDRTNYTAAFPRATSGMGCASTCVGYELILDIDLDTSGSGGNVWTTADAYYNNNGGWEGIGYDAISATRYSGDFNGNGFTVQNLYINRNTTDDVGLFGSIHTSSRFESFGITNASVVGRNDIGILVGANHGDIVACYTTGSVSGGQRIGGLVGSQNDSGSSIQSSYSRASVTATSHGGGLLGRRIDGAVTHAYSTGSVAAGLGVNSDLGGLIGSAASGSATASYWDTTTSGRTTSAGGSGVQGQTTAQLQSPTGYTGIYATWNANIDAAAGNDNPWSFGTTSEYPTLIYGKPIDYDADDDNLIEIIDHLQLNAVRYDLDGNGSVNSADLANYSAAFPKAIPGMGCAATCAGYELAADIDLDTSGSGGNTWTSDDAHYNSGSGWQPIGDSTNQYSANFKGNGYTVDNLFINRTSSSERNTGLFGYLASGIRIEAIGVTNANVTGYRLVGILVGHAAGSIVGSYTTGDVSGNATVGGIAGDAGSSASILSSYSTASITGSGNTGGLLGAVTGTTVTHSYSTGRVNGSASTDGGLIGRDWGSSTITASYWDTTTSNQSSSAGGVGKTTTELQAPTGYADIYAAWNANLDGTTGGDNPWRFGASSEYPTLIYGKPVDYDLDGDNLIEISHHAMLNAVRYDLNGDGAVSATDRTNYTRAFPRAMSGMGCAATCTGYELTTNVDLDTNGSGGNTWTSADAYWNSGAGWLRIGTGAAATRYSGNFNGNGFEVQNLFIDRDGSSGTNDNGLFGSVDTASRIESLGVTSVNIAGNQYAGGLAAISRGTIVACWTTGSVTGSNFVGGLVGWSNSTILSSYSQASATGVTFVGGLLGQVNNAPTITDSYATGLVTRSSGTATTIGGLTGGAAGTGTPSVTTSYYDSTTTGCVSGGTAGCTTSAHGTAQTTSALQTPTDYTGIYSTWNANLDGVAGNDYPWYFGTSSQYPVIIYGKSRDYDRDNDNYIDVVTRAQLDAIRHDLNGNGAQDSVSASNWMTYTSAFPNAADGMGCATTCVGYELLNSIAVGNWGSIGNRNSRYSGDFKGNGFILSGMRIQDASFNAHSTGLFGATTSASRIESVGLTGVSLEAANGMGALVGYNAGTIVGCYATGEVVSIGSSGSEGKNGGLVGENTGTVDSSYANMSRVIGAQHVGGLVGRNTGAITNSYSLGTVERRTGSATSMGRLVGSNSGTINGSYFNSASSINPSNSACRDGCGATGKTAAELQNPIYYHGIYSTWNTNIDGVSGNDYPWHFGTSSDYPVLRQFNKTLIDYDTDGDNYIEVSTVIQLNAIRHDLDGNGTSTSRDYTDYAYYNAMDNMGCAATCVGYELAADIDLDTSGSGGNAWTSADLYYNGGAGWIPIGDATTKYTGDLTGNDYVIDNLFINRSAPYQGLFGYTDGSDIKTLGVTDAGVTGGNFTGIIAGRADGGSIVASYTTGSVSAGSVVGGMIGYSSTNISTSYSRASVSGSGTVGGIVGTQSGNNVLNSYSAGRVSGSGSNVGGLIGRIISAPTVTASYWDTTTSGQSASAGGSGVVGKTTADLQNPTGYSGIYAAWNANLDSTTGGDNPWHFGTASEYPTLIYGKPVDYDTDGDNLIEISHHVMLNAIRWDLDGQGDQDTVGASDWQTYTRAFARAAAGMGCAATCTGYELTTDIDLDTSGSGGNTWTSDDAYWNGGEGWNPIATDTSTGTYDGMFNGNGYEVQNLFINNTADNYQGLFRGLSGSARVESLGVTNANVAGPNYVGAIVGANSGAIVASYTSGTITGNATTGDGCYGGIAGWHNGSIQSSYTTAAVTGYRRAGGLAGIVTGAATVTNSYTIGVVTRTSGSSQATVGAFTGELQTGGSVTASYYATVSGQYASSAAGTAKTPAELQAPVGYGGIYAAWNANLDGTTGGDNPWNFGSASQYPTLHYTDPVDYDLDGDNYIDIVHHAMLNAVRWDLDGNGAVSATDRTNYTAAFPRATSGMGCASTCVGYELIVDIDLDTSGSGGNTWTSADAYHNSGSGWAPIGGTYTGNFNGNGLTVQNLDINRSGATNVGLFGSIGSGGSIVALGVTGANVAGRGLVGILTGASNGAITACYTTGTLSGAWYGGGGLVGVMDSGTVHSSYSHASITGSGSNYGGLVGLRNGGTITNSYSTGSVASALDGGGFIGAENGGTARDSYWDTTTSGRSGSSGGTGKTTAELQSILSYTGIYANWNANLDSVGPPDNPWDFGTASQYPTLTYGKPVDYDSDGDNLIEIIDHFKLNAVRYDLDGDGATSATDRTNYTNAFPRAMDNMGCASTCTGYELSADIDLDTSGSGGNVWTSDDAYYNGGQGWIPIGNSTAWFASNFKGNGYVIDNLDINRSSSDYQALFGYAASSRIETLGVTNADVRGRNYSAVLVGLNQGTIVASYTTGGVSATSYVGALSGYSTGSYSTSYSTAYVSGQTNVGGLIGYQEGNNVTNTYSTGRVVRSGGSAATVGGLIGSISTSPNITASYWDTIASGQSTSAGGAGVVGKTARELQTVTTYTGIYANWNVNLDGQAGNDDPWDLGNGMQYPMLKYDGMSTDPQGGLAMGIPDNWNAPIVGELVGVCLMTPSTRATNTGGTGKKAWIWERSDNGVAWENAGGTITGPTFEYSPTTSDENHFLRAKVELAAGGFAYTRMLGGRVKSASGTATGTDSIGLRHGHTSPVVGTEIEGSAPPSGAVDARVGWQRCPNTEAPHTDCVAILDVDWRSYTPVAADVGNYLRMYIYYQTSGGTWTRIETGFSGQVAASQ